MGCGLSYLTICYFICCLQYFNAYLVLWKIIYEQNGFYYVDAIRLLSKTEICEGTRIKKLNVRKDFKRLDEDSQQFKDIKRFTWFSQDYLGVAEDNSIITDVRYSFIPNEIDGLWGIKIDINKKNTEHVEWVVNRGDYYHQLAKLGNLLLGKGCESLF